MLCGIIIQKVNSGQPDLLALKKPNVLSHYWSLHNSKPNSFFLSRLQYDSQDEALEMINIVMKESWGNLLFIFHWHLFLALIWAFLNKYDKRSSISHPNKLLQITTFLKQIFECNNFSIFLEKYYILSLYIQMWMKFHFHCYAHSYLFLRLIEVLVLWTMKNNIAFANCLSLDTIWFIRLLI